MPPIAIAPGIDTLAQPAVIPTSPANAPFNVIDTSGFLYLIHVTAIVATAPAAATWPGCTGRCRGPPANAGTRSRS